MLQIRQFARTGGIPGHTRFSVRNLTGEELPFPAHERQKSISGLEIRQIQIIKLETKFWNPLTSHADYLFSCYLGQPGNVPGVPGFICGIPVRKGFRQLRNRALKIILSNKAIAGQVIN